MPPSSHRSTNNTSIARPNSTSHMISSLTVGQPCIITTCHPQQWRRRSPPRTSPKPTLDHSKLSKCITITTHVVRRQVNTTHPVLSRTSPPMHSFPRNCPFSLSALSIFFSLVPGGGAWVTRRLVECFRILVQSGYPRPTFSSVPTVLQNRPQSFFCFLSIEHSPRTCDPHHPFSFISTPSSTYHSLPPHPPHVRDVTSHSLQPRVDSLTTFLFIISRHNSCVYFLLFYSFNSIVLLVYSSPPHPSPPLSVPRRANQSSLRSIVLLSHSLHVVCREFGNESSVYFTSNPPGPLLSRSRTVINSLVSVLLVPRLLERRQDLMILSIPHHWEEESRSRGLFDRSCCRTGSLLCARLRVQYPLVLAGGYLRTGLVTGYPVPFGSCTKVSPSRRSPYLCLKGVVAPRRRHH